MWNQPQHQHQLQHQPQNQHQHQYQPPIQHHQPPLPHSVSAEIQIGEVAVAIDKDKGSQYALKWAVDNVLSKGQTVTLLHVKQRQNTNHSTLSKYHFQFPDFFMSFIFMHHKHFFIILIATSNES